MEVQTDRKTEGFEQSGDGLANYCGPQVADMHLLGNIRG
jgi:hypothetical protein